MSIIKRTFTTVYSKLDNMVGEIENHEALIRAAIDEQRKKIAKARVQMARLQNHEITSSKQLAKLRFDEKQWGNRAVQEAENNEDLALQCMQRRKAQQEAITKLDEGISEYQLAITTMKTDISRSEEELVSISQKHQLMKAREASAEALSVVSDVGGSRLDNLADSFDRWEIKLGHTAQSELLEPVDDLEARYLSKESEQQLRVELDLLLKEVSENGNE